MQSSPTCFHKLQLSAQLLLHLLPVVSKHGSHELTLLHQWSLVTAQCSDCPESLLSCSKGETPHTLRLPAGSAPAFLPMLPPGENSSLLQHLPCFGVGFCVFKPSSSWFTHQSTSFHSCSSDCYQHEANEQEEVNHPKITAAVATQDERELHKVRTS